MSLRTYSPRRAVCLLLVGLCAALAGCDRPFVPVRPPAIEVVTPDPSQIFTDPALLLRVSASSFREVARVEVDGRPLTHDPHSGLWEGTLQLRQGLNPLAILAYDRAGVAGGDTVSVLYLPHRYTPGGATLPVPRGGHTATLLPDGRVLVAGGAAAAGAAAERDAFLLRPDETLERLPASLRDARVGHTATLLPDGRVLLLGGARSEALNTVGDLVETAEVFDPAAHTFRRLPIVGAPVRRAFHTAFLRATDGGYEIDVFGGRGDIGFATPRLGLRGDARGFHLRNDTLFALDPAVGSRLSDAVAGHSQSPLDAGPLYTNLPTRYLVAGSYFAPDGYATSVNLRLLLAPRIAIQPAPPFILPRTRHAAAYLEPGLILFDGGMQGAPGSTPEAAEVYVDAAARFYRLPRNPLPVKRYAHTATRLPSQRILLLGGFSPLGSGLRSSEYFQIQPDSR